MKKSNLVTGLLFLALSIFAYIEATNMVAKLASDQLGPSFWPKILSIALGVLSVCLIGQGLFGKQPADAKTPIDIRSEGFWRVVKICGSIILFGALIYVAGIYIGMLVMLPLCMFLHGERNVKILTGLTVLIVVFIFLAFDIALKVPLPAGLLGNYWG